MYCLLYNGVCGWDLLNRARRPRKSTGDKTKNVDRKIREKMGQS